MSYLLKNLFTSPDNKLKLFYEDLKLYKKLNKEDRFKNIDFDIFSCLNDNTSTTPFDAHYIYHPAWAARIVKKINPEFHVDISSTLHFCTLLSAFIKTRFYDYRPANLTLDNLSSQQADLTNLPFESNSIFSLSCMHTIEHIGLGRYGDAVDPEGDTKAIKELKRVCGVNGNLLLVVPVGIKKIKFNAHRIYDPFRIVEDMNGFKLRNFSLINDEGLFLENADLQIAAKQNYGCGCYWFEKLS